jgi:kynurenine formamidase
MFKIIDLSLPHENGATESSSPSIEHSSHEDGVARLAKVAGLTPADFPFSTAMATDIITGKTHSGTHIDAPYHYGPLCEGKPAKTVDQVPLEWLFAPGVVLDMRRKKPGDEITALDMRHALGEIGYEIKPFDIVILQTGADKFWGTTTEEYMANQSGLNVSGLDWLLDQGVMVVGIDAWTLDRPVKAMAESYRETSDKSFLWPSHFHGRNREYIQIEKMANLDSLPKPFGFIVSVLPVKFKGCTAGWCRAVAIFMD